MRGVPGKKTKAAPILSNALPIALVASLVFGAIGAFVGVAFGLPRAFLYVAPLVLLVTIPLNVWAQKLRLGPRAPVELGDGRLRLGELSIRGDEVTHAEVLPRADFTELRLERGRRTTRLALRSPAAAERVLDGLAVTPDKLVTRTTAAETSLDGPVRLLRNVTGAVALVAAVAFRLVVDTALPRPLVGALAAAALLVVVLATLTRSRVTFAEDGVAIQGLFGRTFLPLADIRDVDVGYDARERPMLILGVEGRGAVSLTVDEPERHAERLRRRLSRGGRPPVPAELERGERSTRAWIEALRALGGKVASFREDGVSLADLRAVAHDPRATVAARAAAVVALSAHEAEHDTLTRIAEGTAAPELRIAVEAATSDDDDALAEALEDAQKHA